MKRALALSITTLLLPIAAVAAESPAAARFRLLGTQVASTPAPADRYRVNADASVVTTAGRFRLLGAGAGKAAGDACESGDGLFAHGFEN
jgi:hypothetical protein